MWARKISLMDDKILLKISTLLFGLEITYMSILKFQDLDFEHKNRNE